MRIRSQWHSNRVRNGINIYLSPHARLHAHIYTIRSTYLFFSNLVLDMRQPPAITHTDRLQNEWGGVSPSLYTSPTRAIFAISLSLSFAPLQNLELVDGTLDAPESHLVALCPTHVESALRDGVGWRMAVVAHQRCCGCCIVRVEGLFL